MTDIVFSALQVKWADSTKPDTFIPLCDKVSTEDGSSLKKPKDAKEAVPLSKCLLISRAIFENKIWLKMNGVVDGNMLKHLNNLLILHRTTIHAIKSLIKLEYQVRKVTFQQQNEEAFTLSSWM